MTPYRLGYDDAVHGRPTRPMKEKKAQEDYLAGYRQGTRDISKET